jgi:phosphoribosyl 1,2-cyclic phosphodiesterase
MRVTFYGVRGSVPAPGPTTARYGGNTSCVDVRLADGSILVLDAGTGIRTLGADLMKSGRPPRVHLLLSHTHWDHILGLPFFGPLWQRETELLVYPLPSDAQERFQRTIFDDIHFPVSANDIPAKVEFAKPDGDSWRIGSASVRRIFLNHPGGSPFHAWRSWPLLPLSTAPVRRAEPSAPKRVKLGAQPTCDR